MNIDAALESFRNSIPIDGEQIDDRLAIPPQPFAGQIECTHCNFSCFSAICTQFQKPVRFSDCRFDVLELYATYFLAGIEIERCTVKEPVTFQSGGHNEHRPILIRDTRFESFVDFEDCWFTGPFLLENVTFAKGTNLFGNQDTPMAVSFDIPPELTNVDGELAIDTYGSDPGPANAS